MDAKQAVDKMSGPFMIKTLGKLKIEETPTT